MDIDAIILARTEEVGDCVEWTGTMVRGSSTTPNTPALHTTKDGKDVHIIVARYVWERDVGPIPPGLKVYRTCCNNRCVARKHLAVGTLADVKAVRKLAGQTGHSPSTRAALARSAKARATTKHTDEQARQVRDLLAAGHDRESVAVQTGVALSTVKKIHLGTGWRELLPGASVFNMKGLQL